MKLAIALTAFILVVASSFGWHDRQRLTVARENRTKLLAAATALGVSLDSSPSTGSERITKSGRGRGHENKSFTGVVTAADFLAIAKEIETLEKAGSITGEAAFKRTQENIDRVMLLDSTQLKFFIANLNQTKEITDKFRRDLLRSYLGRLTREQPQTMLALCVESADLFEGGQTFINLVYNSVIARSWQDLASSLEWIRKNRNFLEDHDIDSLEISAIQHVGLRNPKLALKFMSELNTEDRLNVISIIASAPYEAADRTANLAAIRDYLATLADEKERSETSTHTVNGLTRGLNAKGYAAATRWIAGEKFSLSELEKVAYGLDDFKKSEGAGVWIDWMGANLPAATSAPHIDKLVRRWTKDDYQAAGKWLAATPASPTKNTAIRSYAETISPYDLTTATQWAMTLPPGPDRDATLKHIQDNSPAK